MPNLLELMTEEDRATVNEWARKRQTPKYKQDIPMPLFIAAQLGYYYGWQAVVDYRRGYSLGYEPQLIKKGNKMISKLRKTRIAFSLEEAVGLIEAAQKLHYRLKLDEGKVYAANNAACADAKNANKTIKEVNEFAKRIS